MKLMGEACEHKRLRAPTENGGTLIEPSLAEIEKVVERNALAATNYDYDIGGRPLGHLAVDARRELMEAAWNYTRAYRDVALPAMAPETPIFVAGHQPQLFHPGVWFKNFVLSHLAQQQHGVAVNLTIDSDTIKSATIRVPAGTACNPHTESIAFDQQSREIPYEERAIVDPELFRSFGNRAATTIAPLISDPLVQDFWPRVIARAETGCNLGESIAQARHQLEGDWGITTLEIPQSHVCNLPSFHWFTSHLLAHLPRLWEQYNQSVADYRRENHVRSAAHPVPDLTIEGDWLEAPFWIWDESNPHRRPLFVRQRGDEIILSDRNQIEYALALQPEGDVDRAAGQLAELATQGVRIRTRALITTLFARICLGDLFLHGIGGAKYDQVTDQLIERFFGIKPPCYMTLTATLRLPITCGLALPEDACRLDQQLRELRYHPERFVDSGANGSAASLIAQKQQWISTPATPQNAKLRGDHIRQANTQLQPFVESTRAALLANRESLHAQLRATHILASREYAFCLYPADILQRLMAHCISSE